jgi:RNA polymerase sigma-70 factor, ECF subfamily
LEISALYKRYAKLVFGVALAILASREEAEDVTQEVFVALCRGTARYDAARGTMSSFLITLARSRALDRARARSRASRLLRGWHEASPPAQIATPFEQLADERSAACMRRSLKRLSGRERRVVELAYWQGRSQREISADLATPLGTVKHIARRALESLRESLSR